MNKAFYARLAAQNLKRGRDVFLPQMISTAVIGGTFFLMNGLCMSESLENIPSGKTAQMMFSMGQWLFSLFAFFFMFYINSFLVRRRKKEFGLYAVLGLSKGQIGRVLMLENLFSMGLGLVFGVLIARVFGQLLFMLLMCLMHTAEGSVLSFGLPAYLTTVALFAVLFAANAVYGQISVRLSSPMALLKSEKKGDRDSKLLIPAAILGALLMGFAYYCVWSVEDSGTALSAFFPLAMLVILATYLLFESGSVAFLKALRKNQAFYYRTEHFMTVGGLLHRMRQNARGLASICILSTMLIVTVSTTLSLYVGQEEMLRATYPFDVQMYRMPADRLDEADKVISELAASCGLTVTADAGKLVPYDESRWNDLSGYEENVVLPDTKVVVLDHIIAMESDATGGQARLMFDIQGDTFLCAGYLNTLQEVIWERFPVDYSNISDIFNARIDGYGMYGGLLFLGVFFGILFLAVTVLIIYFKQVTEGYEDKERFDILQRVGMDEGQVKATINRQVLWVFFAPVLMTLVHMVFASRIITRMLNAFRLGNWPLVLTCIGGTFALYTLIYLAVYRLTARVYFRIVRRG